MNIPIAFTSNPDLSAAGTSLVGYIDIDYNSLVRVLGEPYRQADGYKVDAEWVIHFHDGTIATIYNYKDGINYLGPEEGTPTEQIRDWHIGGETERAAALVHQLFAPILAGPPIGTHASYGRISEE